MDCKKLGGVYVTSKLKTVPKYLFITCKRAVIFGRKMSGPPKRSNRPVILQRLLIPYTYTFNKNATYRNVSFTLDDGKVIDYKLKGFIVSTL